MGMTYSVEEQELPKDLNVIKNGSDMVTKVPHTTYEYVIYLDEDIKSPDNYREIYQALREASKCDTVKVVLNSYGGYLDSALQLHHALLETKATTVAELYAAYSSASIVALTCDRIIPTKYAAMMIHSLSSGTFGKSGELKQYTDFLDKMNTKVLTEMYSTFLTKNEIEDLFGGKDIWLMSKDIERRLKNWIPFRGRNGENARLIVPKKQK